MSGNGFDQRDPVGIGRFAVILRVLAIQRNMTSVRQVLAVRIAFVAHEERPIEVALSRVGTPISSI